VPPCHIIPQGVLLPPSLAAGEPAHGELQVAFASALESGATDAVLLSVARHLCQCRSQNMVACSHCPVGVDERLTNHY